MDLRRLFVSIAFIAVGLAAVTQIMRFAHDPIPVETTSGIRTVLTILAVFVGWIAGMSLIGFGLLHLFKRGWVGAAIVLGIAFLIYGGAIVVAVLT